MEKKYKIAFVGNTSWSMYNFRLGVMRAIKRQGYDVIVIAPRDAFSAKLVAEGILFKEIDLHSYRKNGYKELLSVGKLIHLYRKEKFDFIFHYTIKPNIYGSIAAYLNSIPSVGVVTGLGKFYRFSNSKMGKLTTAIYSLAGKVSKEIWFLNEEDRDFFLEKKIVTLQKSKILKGEGIDTNWYKRKAYRDENRENIKFLFAGRIIWEKGVGEFVEVARRIKSKFNNVEFQVLGFIDSTNPDSVSFQELQQWQEDGIIKYLGETDDVRSYLEQSDCLVFPSYYREGLSRILLEAASMEVPIVTTDNVGCRDIVIDGESGYIVQVKNIVELESKLVQFLSLSRDELNQMGTLGRQRVLDNFSEERVIERYMEVISNYLPSY